MFRMYSGDVRDSGQAQLRLREAKSETKTPTIILLTNNYQKPSLKNLTDIPGEIASSGVSRIIIILTWT